MVHINFEPPGVVFYENTDFVLFGWLKAMYKPTAINAVSVIGGGLPTSSVRQVFVLGLKYVGGEVNESTLNTGAVIGRVGNLDVRDINIRMAGLRRQTGKRKREKKNKEITHDRMGLICLPIAILSRSLPHTFGLNDLLTKQLPSQHHRRHRKAVVSKPLQLGFLDQFDHPNASHNSC
jgi:hypothetical protein